MVKRKAGPESEEVFANLSKRFLGQGNDFYVGEEENVQFLMDLVKRTVNEGESNSLLVLGPHGAGKSALVGQVMKEASKSKNWLDNVLLVELNGFLQTDDKIALKEITRQLHLENLVGDRVFGSFADHLTFLLSSLQTGDKSSKPIIFILEEFDMFCSHRNQNLLYNLFDVAQTRAVPICVIGVSCQLDVTEVLEKRIKSRFSHRHLYVLHCAKFSRYYELVRQMLTLGQDEVDGANAWNSQVERLLAEKDVERFFESQVYMSDKSISYLKRLLYLALLNVMGQGSYELTLDALQSSLSDAHLTTDPLTSLVKDLSILELCILIAVKHICEIYDNEPFNFEMVYHEFVKFKRRRLPTLPEERSVVFKCWENLLALELVMQKAGVRTQGQQLEYILNTFHLPIPVLKKSIEHYPNCPTEVLQWAGSSLHTANE